MHSADYAVARRPSVRQSHAAILSKRLNLSSNFFHRRVAPPVYFPHNVTVHYSDGDSLTGASNADVYKIAIFNYYVGFLSGKRDKIWPKTGP